MIYTTYFGFSHPPFQPVLAPDQLFRPPLLEELHSRLRHLVDTRALGLLTGEPGSGKSTALRRLRDHYHPDQVRILYIQDTLSHPADFNVWASPVEPGAESTGRAEKQPPHDRAKMMRARQGQGVRLMPSQRARALP